MSATADLASLRAMGQPLVRTRDAAVRLGLTESAASHLLRRLATAGLVRPIRRGLWAIESDVDPIQIAVWLTAPYPSYVSLWTALHAHGMLAQIPRETHLVSLGRPDRIVTPLGTLVVHRMAPEVFGGYQTRKDGVALATPTKAVFDLAYLSAAHGRRYRRLPELDLAHGYNAREARSWAGKIPSARLRTITLDRIRAIEEDAAAAASSKAP
ncbi:MAG: type IV toxin-antitoxin system AbiEi family antitoxin domain-containing protein [Candidatus Limnocylindrales bacterium]|jgi:predicted transcriptional regulator of viral defense system